MAQSVQVWPMPVALLTPTRFKGVRHFDKNKIAVISLADGWLIQQHAVLTHKVRFFHKEPSDFYG